ncbi:MAG: hypothetical protein J2P32_00005, partial [Actinobacteria bacterium]|nr:hypothetical protein [Actinomycetota bacterium]
MLGTGAPLDPADPGPRGGCGTAQASGGLSQARPRPPDAGSSVITAQPSPAYRLVTSSPDVAIQGVHLDGQRFGADSEIERPFRDS